MQILEMICSEILEGHAGSAVAWDDIAGQQQAKRLVQELIVWPMLNPHLFKAWHPPFASRVPHVAQSCPVCQQHAWYADLHSWAVLPMQ